MDIEYCKRFMNAVGKIVPTDIFCKQSENVYTFQDESEDAIGVFGIQITLREEGFSVLTVCWLRVDSENVNKMQILFDSINRIVDRGKFKMAGGSLLIHDMYITYEEIERLENPYEFILHGDKLFEKYHKEIFKALAGIDVMLLEPCP